MKLKYKVALALLVTPTLFIIGKNLNFFTINKIVVKNDGAICLEEGDFVRSLRLLGKNILTAAKIDEKNLLDRYPCVKYFDVQKKLPNELVITAISRQPLARVAEYDLPLDLKEATPSSQTALVDWSIPPSSSPYYIVDDWGVIFNTTESTQSAVLYIANEQIKYGSKLSSEMFNKINLIFKKSAQINEDIQFGKIINDTMLVKTNKKLVFSLSKDIDRQVASLQLILEKAKINGRSVDTIDLRFDKPVVIYGRKL